MKQSPQAQSEKKPETAANAPLDLAQRLQRLSAQVTSLGERDKENLIHVLDEANQVLARQNSELDKLSVNLREALARLDRELEQIRHVQESLLPDEHPKIPGLDFASVYLPGGHASGDYYDFLQIGQDRVGLFVADVSGKGAPAAVVMAITRVLVHEHFQDFTTAAQAVSCLNDKMRRFVPDTLFITAAYALYDLGTNRFTYSTAGHPAPVVWRALEGRAEPLPVKPRFPLNFQPDIEYESLESELKKEDALLLYTDGLTEIRDSEGKFAGEKSLLNWVSEARKESAAQFLGGLIESAAHYSEGEPPEDDFTAIMLMRTQ